MDWAKQQKELTAFARTLHAKTIGKVYAMKVIDISNPILVKNDAKQMSKEFRKKCNKPKEIAFEYKVRKLYIKPMHWPGREYLDEYFANVIISETIWWRIVELTNILKKIGVDYEPKILLYWKRNFNLVWVAFITDKQYVWLKEFMDKFDHKNKDHAEILKQRIAWFGHCAPYRHKKFTRYYVEGIIDADNSTLG